MSLFPLCSPLWARGVEEVENKGNANEIHVQTKSDSEIRRDIEKELGLDPFVESRNVTVTVKDGVATLTGTVDTLTARAAAKVDAFQAGALKVRDRLKVKDRSSD